MAGAVQVIDMHRPKISEALGTLGATLQGQQDSEQARTDSVAKTKAAALMQFAINRGASPEQWNALRQHLASTDPGAAAFIPDIASLPPDQFEQAKAKFAQSQLGIQQTAADRVQGGQANATDLPLVFNPGSAGTEPFRKGQLFDTLSAGSNATPEQQQAAGAELKTRPEANTALVEKTSGPERMARAGQATADAAFTAGPKTTEALAGAAEKRAMAGKAGAETRAISAASSPSAIAASNLTGDDFLKSLPASEARLVKSIADYMVDPAKVASLRNPKDAGSERNRLVKEVLQFDPSYDMTQFPSKNKLRSDFNSGQGAKNVRSINTALSHLDTLAQAAGELHNQGGLPLVTTGVNYLKNKAGQLSGSPAKVKFDTAATAVDNELAAVFKGTGATDQEIAQWRGNLNSNMSPAQMAEAIKSRIELMGGRLAALQSQYQQGMGKPADFSILNPSSRKVLQKFQIDPDALEQGRVTPLSAGGGGGAPGPSTQPPGGKQLNDATAAEFLKQAGGDKEKARQLARAAGFSF